MNLFIREFYRVIKHSLKFRRTQNGCECHAQHFLFFQTSARVAITRSKHEKCVLLLNHFKVNLPTFFVKRDDFMSLQVKYLHTVTTAFLKDACLCKYILVGKKLKNFHMMKRRSAFLCV